MIQIIAHGRHPKDREYTAQCRECKSLLKFKRSEARSVADSRDGDAMVISCPVCSHEIWISEAAAERRMMGGW